MQTLKNVEQTIQEESNLKIKTYKLLSLSAGCEVFQGDFVSIGKAKTTLTTTTALTQQTSYKFVGGIQLLFSCLLMYLVIHLHFDKKET